MNMKNKKGVNEVAIGIIAMALLLIVGSIFLASDDSDNSFTKKRGEGSSGSYDAYLFYLNDTDIGRQRRVTESFPNIELGSKEITNVIYLGSSFRLNANFFSANNYSVDLTFLNPQDVKYILLYFNPDRIWGDNHLIIKVDGKSFIKTLARNSDIPIRIPVRIQNSENFTKTTLSFEIEKPRWYNIINWNKMDISEFRVVEVAKNQENNRREFNFQIDNEKFLERVFIDLVVECNVKKEVSEAIKVTVNGYTISNQNPRCLSRYNKITGNVPKNILNPDANVLELETNGFYTVAYSINKVYFNDQQVYKFTINSFNDIIDVVMYGDFDKEVIDIRLNGQTMSLKRDEIKSIVSHLRFGTNEIKIITKPVEIKEFIIEKNEFLY